MKNEFQNGMRPTLRAYYNDKIGQIQKSLETIFPEATGEAQWFQASLGDKKLIFNKKTSAKALYQPMRQYIKARGKLLRPLLSNLLLEAYGKNPDDFKPILVIAETIHCSSLILDDIVDCSLLRRGEPCSHIVHGVSIAGNGSMAATFYAFNLINDESMPLSESERLKLLEMVYWEHYGCSIGTALDLGWSELKRTEVDRDQYIQHIIYRSCAYTYRVAARLGALSGGATTNDLEAIFTYSTQIGIAFQLIDDILNLEPETKSWGKTIGEDITEGKRSLLVLYTLGEAEHKDRIRLLDILDSKTSNSNIIQEAISIMKKYDAFTNVRNEARKYIDSACIEVDKLSISTHFKSLLKDFAFYVLERKI